MQFAKGTVETDRISRVYFDNFLPFNVVNPSLRCSFCHGGKLMTKSLVRVWPYLNCGLTPGPPYDCCCPLCAGGGCSGYLPTEFVKDVLSTGGL